MVTPRSSKPFDLCSNRSEGAKNKKIMTQLEQQILELRREGLSYTAIQLRLGNPSKKRIKETLKLYAPELLGDVVENYNKLRPKY